MLILRNKISRKNLNKGDIESVEGDDDDISSITNHNTKALENQDGGAESPLKSPNFHRFQKRQDFINKNPETADLYITQAEDIEVLIPHILEFKKATIYDPCCGTGVYGEVLRKHGFEKVIESDLYFGENRLDFLDLLFQIMTLSSKTHHITRNISS